MTWPFKRTHTHVWKTTHTNKWMIPTRQECDCGVTRQVDTSKAEKDLHYRWVYSDGTLSEQLPLGDLGNDGKPIY